MENRRLQTELEGRCRELELEKQASLFLGRWGERWVGGGTVDEMMTSATLVIARLSFICEFLFYSMMIKQWYYYTDMWWSGFAGWQQAPCFMFCCF